MILLWSSSIFLVKTILGLREPLESLTPIELGGDGDAGSLTLGCLATVYH